MITNKEYILSLDDEYISNAMISRIYPGLLSDIDILEKIFSVYPLNVLQHKTINDDIKIKYIKKLVSKDYVIVDAKRKRRWIEISVSESILKYVNLISSDDICMEFIENYLNRNVCNARNIFQRFGKDNDIFCLNSEVYRLSNVDETIRVLELLYNDILETKSINKYNIKLNINIPYDTYFINKVICIFELIQKICTIKCMGKIDLYTSVHQESWFDFANSDHVDSTLVFRLLSIIYSVNTLPITSDVMLKHLYMYMVSNKDIFSLINSYNDSGLCMFLYDNLISHKLVSSRYGFSEDDYEDFLNIFDEYINEG